MIKTDPFRNLSSAVIPSAAGDLLQTSQYSAGDPRRKKRSSGRLRMTA